MLDLLLTTFKSLSHVCIALSFVSLQWVDNHLAGIRAEDVVAGFRRIPVGFYILIQFDGAKRRTENKPVRFHDSVVEWDDMVQLWVFLYSIWFVSLMISRPSEPLTKVQISVCASFEFSPMLGNGEILRTVEICVGDLLDNTRREHSISSTDGKC